MKAIVMREHGGPDVLRLEEVATPVPGPGEVLVRVGAVTVNRTLDLLVRQTGGDYRPVLPAVLGVDPSGEVVALGDGVEEPRVGDRVALSSGVRCGLCENCRAGKTAACTSRKMLGVHVWGGYAEYVVAPAENAVPVPDGLPFADASVVIRHFPTALGLIKRAGLQAGEWALVMGAAGGLGSCIVQLAAQMGATVIAAAGADERVDAARKLGAIHGVNYRVQDLAKAVKALTEGRGVEVVFENIADPTLWPGAFDSLARNGRLATIGAHGGGKVPLDVRRLYGQRLSLLGGQAPVSREEYADLLQMAGAGKLQALVDRVMPLREAAAAHRLVEDNEPLGKVVLDPTLD